MRISSGSRITGRESKNIQKVSEPHLGLFQESNFIDNLYGSDKLRKTLFARENFKENFPHHDFNMRSQESTISSHEKNKYTQRLSHRIDLVRDGMFQK